MKTKGNIVASMLLISAVLTFCVFAQNQTNKERDLRVAPFVVGKGVGPGKPFTEGVSQLQAVIREDGSVDRFKIISNSADNPAIERGNNCFVPGPVHSCSASLYKYAVGNLRIEMLDGSVQEIDLSRVKTITLQ